MRKQAFSWEVIMRTLVVLGLSFGVLACSSQGLEVDPAAVQEGAGSPVTTSGSPSLKIGSCPSTSGVPELSRACMFDSKGKTHRIDGSLPVFSVSPPYGAQFHFKDGYVPLLADVSTEGTGASVGVYAAPYDVKHSPCCSEDREENRIAARTELSASGVLTVTVDQAVPSGTQIAIILDFGVLYQGRVSPVCDLPNPQRCQTVGASGFATRFYVGSEPKSSNPSTSVPVSQTNAGACLLEYNTALVSEGADPCCYRKGGRNTCDAKIQCNVRSGEGCCLIYGTEATKDGQRCCLYADGSDNDGAGECAELLAAP
jgi:hypothetical protein